MITFSFNITDIIPAAISAVIGVAAGYKFKNPIVDTVAQVIVKEVAAPVRETEHRFLIVKHIGNKEVPIYEGTDGDIAIRLWEGIKSDVQNNCNHHFYDNGHMRDYYNGAK